MPVLEVKARRIGGATYQVPIDVKTRQTSGFSSSLDYIFTPVREVRRPWKRDLQKRSWMQLTTLVHL